MFLHMQNWKIHQRGWKKRDPFYQWKNVCLCQRSIPVAGLKSKDLSFCLFPLGKPLLGFQSHFSPANLFINTSCVLSAVVMGKGWQVCTGTVSFSLWGVNNFVQNLHKCGRWMFRTKRCPQWYKSQQLCFSKCNQIPLVTPRENWEEILSFGEYLVFTTINPVLVDLRATLSTCCRI